MRSTRGRWRTRLRKDKVRVPIAGISHWRDPEFSAQQAAAGLDLIDDRLYWSPPRGATPSIARSSGAWTAAFSPVRLINEGPIVPTW